MDYDINKLSVKELGLKFPVSLSDYDPSWIVLYREERKRIFNSFRPGLLVRAEHIGSTAIPGMCAKPTVDILLEVINSAADDTIINTLKEAGYSFIPKPGNPAPHMMFAKGYSINGYTGQTYHVHVRYPGVHNEILFRDYLIRNPEAAEEYADLKRKLASIFINNREEYTDGKTEFVNKIIIHAKQ